MAGAFVLGFNLPARAVNEPEQPPDNTQGKFAPNAFIRIDGSGQTTLVMPQVEMGQGVYTAIPMILADELDADFSKVVLQHAPPNEKLYANPTFGVQVTGNSNSIRAFWKPLRMAGAAARLMLVQAAAPQGDRFDAEYEVPFLAHATMEPLNCTVHVTSDRCEVWVGSQVIARAQSDAAKAAGLPLEKVTTHNHLLGGGFGRRLEADMVATAVRIGKNVDGPVKVVWTREEDIQHDIYRPVYRDVISATLSDGKIAAWKYRISGSSIMARWLPPAFQGGIDVDAVDSAVDSPYDIPNFQVEYVRAEPPAVPTGFWRGVGPNNNVFATECFMDELARKAGVDPIAFRIRMLDKTPRLKAALQLVAEKSGWGQPLPAHAVSVRSPHLAAS
jgi:isoquinoline 1-oxidoreductase beta subunit